MERLVLTIESKDGSPINPYLKVLWGEHPEFLKKIGDDNITVTKMPGQLAAAGEDPRIGRITMVIAADIYGSDNPDLTQMRMELMRFNEKMAARLKLTVTETVEMDDS